MNRTVKILCISSLIFLQINSGYSQDGSPKASEMEKEGPMISFNGLGRSYIGQTTIGGAILETDPSTISSVTDGEFLLDLAVNAMPNKITEVQTILRLRNEFGGFFGAGMSVEVRELWARGIIADILKYRVGDMDLVMTPYTLYNSTEEGHVNEASIFKTQREVLYYEQFYSDIHTRRLQGGNLEFGLDFANILEELHVNAYIARVRGTNFLSIPSRFNSGTKLDFSSSVLSETMGTKFDFGLNFSYTFDDLKSGDANDGIRNGVYTLNFDLVLLNKENLTFSILGETGQSTLRSMEDTIEIFKEDDTFLDLGLKLKLKESKLELSASLIDVGPDFFSIGSQSKRIDFQAKKSFYHRIGLDDQIRLPALFDLTRDRALYTFQFSDQLMTYDPRFSNSMPYGASTPNRRGLKFAVNYGNSEEPIQVFIRVALLSEIRGQGTFELKKFRNLQAAANFNVNQMLDFDNVLKLTLGYQFENTSRGGLEVEQVQLRSSLIDAGMEYELFSNFIIQIGSKMLFATGSDYVPEYRAFNDIKDFPGRFEADGSETLLAAGLKYTFKEGINLSLQYQSFNSRLGENNPNDYNFNQFFVLYSMKF